MQQKLRSREETMHSAHKDLQQELEGAKDESAELQRKLLVAERQLAQFRKQVWSPASCPTLHLRWVSATT